MLERKNEGGQMIFNRMRVVYFLIMVIFGMPSAVLGAEAVHDVKGVGHETDESVFAEKTLSYITEIEKYNREVMGIIGASSELDRVRLEWPHGNEENKNLLNLKYFIPWVLEKKQRELSEKTDSGRGDGEKDPITPIKLAEIANYFGKSGVVGTLLLIPTAVQSLTESHMSQSKQMLVSTLRNDAVALTAMQTPVVIPDFPEMTNTQEIYDGMSQLVLAQLGVLNENIGLDAVKSEVDSIRHMRYRERRTDEDNLNKGLDQAKPNPGKYKGLE